MSFINAEIEKLLSRCLVTNHLKVTLGFFGRQAYVRIVRLVLEKLYWEFIIYIIKA